ncbi:HDOD domain-containing protein [Gracilinema caldarium]|uniref:HDOD domain-containing protein n=1 Tax=Gracilinema caldarium TaxID=215591 RepID=UPI0026F0E60E|nr:HDOD domain-containing protein [Gracilinema caldarium]
MEQVDYLKGLKNLPINPAISSKVLEMIEKKEFSFKHLESLISADPGLTTKILRIANSALYARQNKITKLQTAISMLGLNTIKNLVILVTGTSLFKQYTGSWFYNMFWHHSLDTAFIAKDMAGNCGLQDQAEELFIAGLLHNVGQIPLYLHKPETYDSLVKQVIQEERRFSELEQKVYGTTHRELGGLLLTQWSFPSLFCDCAREHGNINITSSWKKQILIVSNASFIASNWSYFEKKPKDFQLLEGQLRQLGRDIQNIRVYETQFRSILAQDPFYKECRELIRE